MIFLVITILITTSFFILFRAFPFFKVTTFHAIVTNYCVCVLIGILTTEAHTSIGSVSLTQNWVILSLFTGSLFLISFFLTALTVNKVSVTVSSIASKTSLVIPVSVSLLFFPAVNKTLSFINYLGIFFALVSIVLASIKADKKFLSKQHKIRNFMLPLLVFVLAGSIDALINYLNLRYSAEKGFLLFPVFAFSAAAGLGILSMLISGAFKKLKLQSVLAGIMLGIPNYYSIVFLINTLKAFNNDGAVVFPLLNTGIIILASFIAASFFKEKLHTLNMVGIGLAIVAIVCIFL